MLQELNFLLLKFSFEILWSNYGQLPYNRYSIIKSRNEKRKIKCNSVLANIVTDAKLHALYSPAYIFKPIINIRNAKKKLLFLNDTGKIIKRQRKNYGHFLLSHGERCVVEFAVDFDS